MTAFVKDGLVLLKGGEFVCMLSGKGECYRGGTSAFLFVPE